MFTGKKYDDTLNLTAGFHGIEVPVTEKRWYQLLDIQSDGYLTLMDGDQTKEDAALGHAENGKDFDEAGAEIVRRFEAEENLKVAVLSIMGKYLVVECAKDTD